MDVDFPYRSGGGRTACRAFGGRDVMAFRDDSGGRNSIRENLVNNSMTKFGCSFWPFDANSIEDHVGLVCIDGGRSNTIVVHTFFLDLVFFRSHILVTN